MSRRMACEKKIIQIVNLINDGQTGNFVSKSQELGYSSWKKKQPTNNGIC